MTNPDLDPSWVLALDVSHYQGTVDCNSVAQEFFSSLLKAERQKFTRPALAKFESSEGRLLEADGQKDFDFEISPRS